MVGSNDNTGDLKRFIQRIPTESSWIYIREFQLAWETIGSGGLKPHDNDGGLEILDCPAVSPI